MKSSYSRQKKKNKMGQREHPRTPVGWTERVENYKKMALEKKK
jgi:hypothetical protein